jgi:hypothetical protein
MSLRSDGSRCTVTVDLLPCQVEWLDRKAAEATIRRSAYVRQLLQRLMANEPIEAA